MQVVHRKCTVRLRNDLKIFKRVLGRHKMHKPGNDANPFACLGGKKNYSDSKYFNVSGWLQSPYSS